ncbi:MAG TPA: FGGY-family carbohydrate kinase [Spirochaetales bacterium]|nr:FGGY-family carbohydrate kinase [Spirochaetales bacterium]
MSRIILAIDIGTTSAKAALFDSEASCSALAKADIPTLHLEDPVCHEVAPSAWEMAVASMAWDLAGDDPAGFRSIEAVVVSGNGPTIVPIDANGKPLWNALTWMDRRASAEAADAGRALGRQIDPEYNLPKILWFREHKPDVYEKTRLFVSCPEYICGRLSGRWTTFLPAQGFEEIIWDDEALEALKLDKEKFPPFAKPGERLGVVTAEGEDLFGLPEGVSVIAAGPDFVASLLGTDTTRPGRACDRSGTSEGINLCTDKAMPKDDRLLFMPHVISPYRNISGVISTSGEALNWFRRTLGVNTGAGTGLGATLESYEALFAQAARAAAGADKLLFLPYLAGERAPIWNPDARGVFFGLTLRHGHAEMARAVLESTAFAMRDVIDVMESLGAKVSDLRVTGRSSRNPVWNQIKADITGKPVLAPRFSDAELLGDLSIALYSLEGGGSVESGGPTDDGVDVNSLVDLTARIARIERIFEPDSTKTKLYDDLFGVYRQTYKALMPAFVSLKNAGAPLDPLERNI